MNKFDIENVIKEAEKHWAEWEKAGLQGNLESIVRLAYARGEQKQNQEYVDILKEHEKMFEAIRNHALVLLEGGT